MNALKIFIRCLIGCTLGSSLGVAMMFLGLFEQGLGLAIGGATLGFVLAIAGVLYRTSAGETFGRGLLIFLQLTAGKNVPGGEKLVPIEDKDTPSKRAPDGADPAGFADWSAVGAKIGGLCAVAPAVLLVVFFPENADGQPSDPLTEVFGRICAFFITLLVGAGVGAALASLIVPGRHRLNILLGTFVGLALGVGIATALAPGAKITRLQAYSIFSGMFAWLGMMCGLFAGDNETDDDADAEAAPYERPPSAKPPDPMPFIYPTPETLDGEDERE